MASLLTAYVRLSLEPGTKATFQRATDRELSGAVTPAATKHGKLFGRSFAKASAVGIAAGGGLMFGIDAAVRGLGTVVKAARGLETGPLKVAAERAGVSWEKFSKQLDVSHSRMEKLGFTNADVNKSLTRLVTTTGNSQVSMRSLGAAADYARFKHISLEDASSALAKASVGSTRALKDVGIATSDLPKHFATSGTAASRMRIVMDLLNKKIGGQAQEAAGTLGGKLDVLKARFTDMAANIGVAIIPLLKNLADIAAKYLVPAFQSFGKWLTTTGVPALNKFLKAAMPIVTKVIGYFVTGLQTLIKWAGSLPGPLKIAGLAIIGLGIAMKIATAANPWVLLGLAIITVIGIIVKNWAKIKSFTAGVWHAILGFIKGVWDWIKANWPLLLAILTGPIGLAVKFIIDHWGTVKRAVKAVWDWMKSAWKAVVDFLKGVFTPVIDFFKTRWNNLKANVKLVWDWFKTGWNALGQFWRGVFKAFADFFINLWNREKAAVKLVWDWMRNTWKNLVQGLRDIFGWFVGKLLGFFGNILHGAATAFGWIPGLGGKLKEADKAFQRFRDNVNNALRGINGRTVNVGVNWTSDTAGGRHVGRPGFATGGPIKGPGGPRDDKAGLFALSDDEYVMQASAHRKYGTRFMDDVNAGRLASGGTTATGVNIQTHLPSPNKVVQSIWDSIEKLANNFQFINASAGAIIRLAASFLGRVPYVWGGTTPAGWDCSGFLSYLYRQAGIMRGRLTAEGFREAGKHTPGPVPGGWVTFGAPAYHVALALGGTRTLEAGGGMTPTFGTIAGASAFGLPPRGFARGGIISEPIIGVGRSGRRYTFGERGPETVTPGAGATIHIDQVVVRDQTDIDLLSRRLGFAMAAGSLG